MAATAGLAVGLSRTPPPDASNHAAGAAAVQIEAVGVETACLVT